MICKVLLITAIVMLAEATLDDQDFLNKYKVKIHKRGSFGEHPSKGDNVKVHYTVIIRDL